MSDRSITRVCHVIVGLNVGGAELMLNRLIQSHLSSVGYEHAVISLTSLGSVGARLQAQGVEVQVLDLRGAWDVLPKLVALMKIFQQIRPDVVQTWMYHADFLGGLAARMAGIKNVIWGIRATDVSAGGSRATGAVRWLCARLSRWIPHTIVCAAEASRRVHVALGYRADRMTVVPNGFDLPRLQATPEQVAGLRSACGFSADKVVVGTLGRFNAVKDPHNFVRAAGLLAREYPRVQFLMVGRDCDAANAQLIGWIKATGYADRFVLLGERSDAPVCLAAMDVFCLSSRTEGFPNVVGEAMAMRKACVVTDVGDAAYLLGDCGVVVPKEDSAALADGMTQLVSLSVADRAEVGERAHARIASEFTMDRTRERFEAVYANVLSGQALQQVNKNKQG